MYEDLTVHTITASGVKFEILQNVQIAIETGSQNLIEFIYKS